MRIVSVFILLLLSVTSVNAEKIREIANIIGVRENQVIGYGLVVGLNGTVYVWGDQEQLRVEGTALTLTTSALKGVLTYS